jgi:DNA polymerase sigma
MAVELQSIHDSSEQSHFLKRWYLVLFISSQVTSRPNQVPRLQGRTHRPLAECRHDMDAFTPGLLALYESLKPSEEHSSKQKQLVDSLAKSVSKEWPNA